MATVVLVLAETLPAGSPKNAALCEAALEAVSAAVAQAGTAPDTSLAAPRGVDSMEEDAQGGGAYLFVSTGTDASVFQELIAAIGLDSIGPGGSPERPRVAVAHLLCGQQSSTAAEVTAMLHSYLRRKGYGHVARLVAVTPGRAKDALAVEPTLRDCAAAAEASPFSLRTLVSVVSAQERALARDTALALPRLVVVLGQQLDSAPNGMHEAIVEQTTAHLRRMHQEQPADDRVLFVAGCGRLLRTSTMHSHGDKAIGDIIKQNSLETCDEYLHKHLVKEIGLENVGGASTAILRSTYLVPMHNNNVAEIAEACKKLMARKGFALFRDVAVITPIVVPGGSVAHEFVNDMIRVTRTSVETPWHKAPMEGVQAPYHNPLLHAEIDLVPVVWSADPLNEHPMDVAELAASAMRARPREALQPRDEGDERLEGVEMGEFGENEHILRMLMQSFPSRFVQPPAAAGMAPVAPP